ncbi:hypothetical protein AN639_08925 [Candidatus Epulonipiscium fishelsonii]|uniref:Uncharacterized protein n=1 Tax=Candidatus Epulonipiscium fishelsonii TaxID=77094 RepID=A0ACC8XDL1_9FIRM|nr:hypothetical protein AN639_08925 [Epulopiscium sp. SCG-B05WGA-EpuloA1]ONI40968.1 hypothetical protein AN396_04210 [Epulopiscium sp. SCG-B11WGA-EpuloA1]
MKLEVIAVGNEVVFGHTINTNASLISKKLDELGIEPCYHVAVRDREEDIKQVLEIALNRADVIIFCGGLGPTKDDLTKEAVCKFLNKPLLLNEEAFNNLKALFRKFGKDMSENNVKQAMFPVDCCILKNDHGTAPGCLFNLDNNKYVALLPGPPKEVGPMMDILINDHFASLKTHIYITEEINVRGIGESSIEAENSDLFGVFDDVECATYIAQDYIVIRIKARGVTKEDAQDKLNYYKFKFIERLNAYIIGYNS